MPIVASVHICPSCVQIAGCSMIWMRALHHQSLTSVRRLVPKPHADPCRSPDSVGRQRKYQNLHLMPTHILTLADSKTVIISASGTVYTQQQTSGQAWVQAGRPNRIFGLARCNVICLRIWHGWHSQMFLKTPNTGLQTHASPVSDPPTEVQCHQGLNI